MMGPNPIRRHPNHELLSDLTTILNATQDIDEALSSTLVAKFALRNKLRRIEEANRRISEVITRLVPG